MATLRGSSKQAKQRRRRARRVRVGAPDGRLTPVAGVEAVRELDRVLGWLTGYDAAGLQQQCEGGQDLAAFFDRAPAFTAAADRITGTVCGVRVETVEHPLMRKIRQMDKLVDELAKGRPLDKILRA